MNKAISSTIITFLLIINSTNIYGQTQWKSLKDKNFSISYPLTWELNQSGLMGTKFIILSPLSTPSDKFRENINLIIQDLKVSNMSLDTFVETSENHVKTFITDGEILESNRISDKNSEFHKLVYSGKQGNFNLKFIQYFWIINNKAYVLTYTAETNEYDTFLPLVKNMIGNFKIIK